MSQENEKPNSESAEDFGLKLNKNTETMLDGKFLLLEELGRGASGTVYKARHLMLDQIVAIKIIDLRLSSSENAVKRFQSEASILSSFSHPNIVKSISFGNLPDGRQYMVLEFLDGESLEKHLKKTGPMEQEPAVALFIDIAQALGYAHERGVVHRDVKPGNVILQRAGDRLTAKLVDFGIYKDATSSAPGLTQTGLLVGSANYMSPEQCKSLATDGRSDLYSLGCLMYETVVGVPPMQADNELVIMSNHLNMPTTSVPSMKTISLELEQIIIRCLKKNPDERYQSAKDLLAALATCLDSEPKRKKSKDKRLFAVLAVLPFLIVSLGFLYYAKPKLKVNPEIKLSDSSKRATYHFNRNAPPPREEDLEDWLAQATKLHSVNENWLITSLHRLANYRSRNQLEDSPVPYGKEVEEKLQEAVTRDENADYSAVDLKESLWHLAYLAQAQLINFEPEKLKQTLSKLEKLQTRVPEHLRHEAWMYIDLVAIESERGNYRNAINYAAIAEKMDQGIGLPHAYFQGARNYVKLGDLENTLSKANRAIDCSEKIMKREGVLTAVNVLPICSLIYPMSPTKVRHILDTYFSTDEQMNTEANRSFKHEVEELRARAYLCLHLHSSAEKILVKAIERCKREKDPWLNKLFLLNLEALHGQGKDAEAEAGLWKFLEEAKKQGDETYLQTLYEFNSVGYAPQVRAKLREIILKAVNQPSMKSRFPLECARLLYQECGTCVNNGNYEQACKVAKEAEELLSPLVKNKHPSAAESLFFICETHLTAAYLLKDPKAMEEIYKLGRKAIAGNADRQYSIDVAYAYYLQAFDVAQSIKLNEELFKKFENKSVQYASSFYNCAAHLAALIESTDRERAVAVLKKGLEQLARYRGNHFYERESLSTQLASVYKRMGKTAEQEACLKRAAYFKECTDRMTGR